MSSSSSGRDSESPQTRDAPPAPAGAAAAWAGVLLPIAAFIIALNAAYTVVSPSCIRGTEGPLHLSLLAGLVLTLGGLGLSWWSWREAGGRWPDGHGPWKGDRPFMGLVGLSLGLLVVFVITGQWMSVLVLSPCQ